VAQMQGGSKTRQLIVDTALDYLRRMSADAHSDPSLALDLGTAYMRVARVQGVNIAPNLGQTDQADQAAAKAQALIESVLAAEPQNRTALLRAAQIAHDRMILAGDKHHDDVALKFARQSAARVEQYLATGSLNEKSDRREAQQVIITLINVANRYMKADQYDEAIRICGRATAIARVTNWPTQGGATLMIVALAQRAKGNLDEALQAIRESVRILQPPPELKASGRVMSFTLALVREGQILGEDNGINLGRTAEAVQSLERALDIARDGAARDLTDFSSQYRVFTAETKLAAILRHTEPRRALELYDDALQRLTRTAGNAGNSLNEVGALAASTDPLLRLGKTAEARRRLDLAFERLAQLKLYPSPKIELGSAVDDALRASAEYEAGSGNARRGAAIYQELLRGIFAAEPQPAATLSDAVELSNVYRAASRMYRRAGVVDEAAAVETRHLQLWQRWDASLPNNAFVRRQLEALKPR
jgi:tetratricopeptide (TPR) repeat protein